MVGTATSQVTEAGGEYAGRWLLIVLFAMVLATLAAIPGYYSFDELQWLARGRMSPLPWASWTRWDVPQYRPLTFNLWLWLSHVAGYVPWRLHVVWALLAAVNAWLLSRVARSFGLRALRAWWPALAFLFTPYAMFVHAWVGTLADVLVLLFALLAVLWLRRPAAWLPGRGRAADVVVTAVATALALASKESAVVLPLLLASAAYRHPRPVRMVLPVAIAALLVGIYLALRIHAILYLPQAVGAYTWSLANIPVNVARYVIYPFVPGSFEVHTVLLNSRHVTYVGAILAAAMFVVAAQAGWRWFLALLAAIALLGPVLILDVQGDQYAYLASAAVCVLFALAMPAMPRAARRILLLLVVVASLHGAWVAARMISVARVQQRLYADLLPRLEAAGEAPLRITSERPGDIWLPQRLLYEVPSYRGVAMSGRVVVVASGETADLVMAHDGHLNAVAAAARVK